MKQRIEESCGAFRQRPSPTRLPNFSTGEVVPVNRFSGAEHDSFTTDTFLTLRDPWHRIPFPVVADGVQYPGTATGGGTIAVDPAIRNGRLLTGADFDIESIRQAADGTLWFGDEFGPYLVHTDANGNLLKEEVADLMNIYDPRDVAGDGRTKTVFTFPFQTIEDLLVLDETTLLVINDNNFPFSSGREFGVADNNEFILIHTAPLIRGKDHCGAGKHEDGELDADEYDRSEDRGHGCWRD
jgi:hypothetical protein